MHPDLAELLKSLNSNGVEFMVVGATATAVHAQPRYTDDLDLWLRRTEDNVERLHKTLAEMGFTIRKVDYQAFWRKPGQKIMLGTEPTTVDLFNFQTACSFDEAWERKVGLHFEGAPVAVIGLHDLVRIKRTVGGYLHEFDIALVEEIHGAIA